MASAWDRVAARYVDLWVPRLLPYYDDLVRELGAQPGERILVTSVGPGIELAPITRAMGGRGTLRATDRSSAMIVHARASLAAAAVGMAVDLAEADAGDVAGAPWDAVVSSFALWQLDRRDEALRAWSRALGPRGRVALLVWGPPVPTAPWELAGAALAEVEPSLAAVTARRDLAGREAMVGMLREAGLDLVRHRIVRHPMNFGSAQGFFQALCEGCSLAGYSERIGPERTRKVEEAFYAKLPPGEGGAPAASSPLVLAPQATVAIARRA